MTIATPSSTAVVTSSAGIRGTLRGELTTSRAMVSAMVTPEIHLYLPQIRMPLDAIVERARVAEAAGFDGMSFMDHLTPPAANHQPMWEAMTLSTWVAAHTERLTLGHLVLADLFRHPADLARQASTIDHASGGTVRAGHRLGVATPGVGDVRVPARRPPANEPGDSTRA